MRHAEEDFAALEYDLALRQARYRHLRIAAHDQHGAIRERHASTGTGDRPDQPLGLSIALGQ